MKRLLLCATIWALAPPAAPASPAHAPASGRSIVDSRLDRSVARLVSVGARTCEQRVGPYVTQDRARLAWHRMRGAGYEVSAGVAPCRSDGARGYCFFVTRPC